MSDAVHSFRARKARASAFVWFAVDRAECSGRQRDPTARGSVLLLRGRPPTTIAGRLVAHVLFRAGVVERRELFAAQSHDLRLQAAMALDPVADFRRV